MKPRKRPWYATRMGGLIVPTIVILCLAAIYYFGVLRNYETTKAPDEPIAVPPTHDRENAPQPNIKPIQKERPPDKTPEQLRAEEVAKRILSGASIPDQEPIQTAGRQTYAKRLPKEDSSNDMPPGWSPAIWNELQLKERPIVVQMAKLGFVSGHATKPEWILDSARLSQMTKEIAEGKYNTYAVGLLAHYISHKVGSIQEAVRLNNAELSGDAVAKQKRDAMKEMYRTEYTHLRELMNGADVYERLQQYRMRYPNMFR